MAQKYIKTQNNNSHSPAYGKYYATAVYDNNFIGTSQGGSSEGGGTTTGGGTDDNGDDTNGQLP